MNKKSFLEFDISVSADKKRRSKRSSVSGGFEASTRVCQVDDCNKEGKFRAPKSPKDLDNFFWFCLDHVKEYNNRWNYFQNHSEEEFDKELQLSKTWGRPTKPFGSKNEKDRVHSDGNSHLRFGLDDPYGLFKNKSDKNERSATQNEGGRKRLNLSEKKALGILGALDTMTKSEIRKLYKILIKDLHPDMNEGKRDDEERMTEVVWAWEQINKSIRFKE
tara:strand:+ start:230 stop:886 length:657 start_codon:yes stop_codon:yes gene_type:complete